MMKPPPGRACRAVGLAACITIAGLVAACGSSPGSSTRPAVTVTVTAPAPSTPATTTTTPAPAPAGPPGCATSALAVSLGAGSAAAGSAYYPVEFTNNSSSTCSLYGYPGVSFVSASGAQAGAAAMEDPTYPRQLVTLAPGGTAHADLKVTDAQNYPSSRCDPVTVHRLRVFPPGQTSGLYLTLTAMACARTSVQILAVQTVQPGKDSQ